VGKPPKQRLKDREQQRRAARELAARKHHRRQRVYAIIALVALVALVLATVAVGAFSGDDETTSPTTTLFPNASTTPGPSLPPTDVSLPPPGETLTEPTECPAADGSSPRVTTFAGPPPMCIDPTKPPRAISSPSSTPSRRPRP
jgi:hypothetical protein